MKNRVRILLCLVEVLIFGLCVFTACNTTTIQKVRFKVTFEVDGISYYEIDTQGTEVLHMPNNPTKEDYIFDGWYWDKDTLTRPFTANSLLNEPLNSDMRVYAKWKRDCDHNAVVDKGYATTCTEDGLTDGSHCSKCNDVLIAQEVISASGHDIQQVNAQEPTCTETGWNAYEYCTKCDYTTKVEINASGHNIKQAGAKAPTCMEVGWNAYEYCTKCDYTTKVEIKANGHDIKQVSAQEPTCAETGWNAYEYCTKCDYTTKVVMPANGHHFKIDWENNSTHHWHEADCGHNVTTAPEKHTYDKNWQCTLCSYQNTEPHGTELQAKTLTTNGTNLYTKVSNSTVTYSFINEISVADGAIYTVHTDISCSGMSELRSKTAPLSIGDNVLYILVSNGNDVALYTATIRRRPVYEVTFNTAGGVEVSSQQIEEGSLATEPTTTRKGYTFDKWDYDFAEPIVGNTTVTASWEIITYSIRYILNGGKNASTNVTTYTVEDGTIVFDDAIGENLFCGWYENNINGTYIGQISSTHCNNITLYARFDGTHGLVIKDGEVTGYTGNGNVVKIPHKYKGYDITKIKLCAFEDCSNLTSITIPDSVTSIGARAFSGCSSLTSITIPNSVTSIEWNAFGGCSSLKSVYITDLAKWCGVSFGGSDANPLDYAHNLYLNGELVTDLVIPDGVTSIGELAFHYCTSLMSITIPDSVKSIGEFAFSGCYRLVEVYNQSSLNITAGSRDNGCVGDYAKNVYTKDNESKLTTTADGFVVYDKTTVVNYIGSATDITISDSVTSIGSGAFYGCSGLTGVTIPDSVTSIGKFAFYGCSGLTNITIPDSVTSISDYAFYRCYRLVEVYNKSSLNITANSEDNGYVGYYAKNVYTMLNGSKLTTTFDGFVIYDGNTLANYVGNATDITIPDSVTSIGRSAFSGCSGLTSVTIGNSVTSIGTEAFFGCSGLKAVYITDISKWCGISFGSSDANPLYYAHNLYLNGELVVDLVIPNNVTSIGSDAFIGCSSFTSVTIGNGVTSIGNSAFKGCSRLTRVTIGDRVTNIVQYAFNGCSSLTSITIPDSVTRIGERVFEGCSKLTNIKFNSTSGWYRTTNYADGYNKTNGTSTSVIYASTNATYFTNTYVAYYWYRK